VIVKNQILTIYSPSSCYNPVSTSFFCWTQKKRFWRTWWSWWTPTPLEVNGVPSTGTLILQNIFFCVRNSYRFGTIWGWL